MNAVFKYCPKCGEKSLSSPQPKLIECGRCDFHFYRNPAVATAAVITDDKGDIVLIRRAKDPARGKLGMPGGFVDIGERAEDGLRREVKEEICIELHEVDFLASFPNEYVYRGIMYPTVDLFFTARVKSFESARESSEVDGLVVRRPAEIAPADLAFDSMRHALDAFRRRTAL